MLVTLRAITSGQGIVSENNRISISIFLFLMWALTLFFLNRRINEKKELEKRLEKYEKN